MAVQLVIYCHNSIALGRMAQVMVERQREDFRVSPTLYTRFHALWGRLVPARLRTFPERAHPWRAHRGVSAVQRSGAFVRVRVGAQLLPFVGFGGILSAAPQQAFAETYLEPPIPAEG